MDALKSRASLPMLKGKRLVGISMFEIAMTVFAAVVGMLISIGIHFRVSTGTARIGWAVVDLLWVLGLIFAVANQMNEFNRRSDHADSLAQEQVLSRERESLRLRAFLAERRTCPYMIGASASTRPQPLCNALTETEFEASRPSFSTLDAQRVEKHLTSADSTDQLRDLRQQLSAYAQHSSKVAPAVAPTPYDEGLKQHEHYRRYLWLVLILFGLRVGRSTADIQRAWASRKAP